MDRFLRGVFVDLDVLSGCIGWVALAEWVDLRCRLSSIIVLCVP